MILFISFLALLFLVSGAMGYIRLLRLQHLTKARLANGLLTASLVLAVMSFAYLSGVFSQSLATKITMSLYVIAAGFFMGFGIKLIVLRRNAGKIEYMYRSFWTDVAPTFIMVGLFVFGIYRTGVLEWEYFTGIGLTSGVSLIGFAFWGWTVPIVPEFRKTGILMLDDIVTWEKIVAFRWESEGTLMLEYMNEARNISEFKTFIPPEDEIMVERLLKEKIKEHEEERRNIILDKD